MFLSILTFFTFALSPLLPLAAADFLISNVTTCMGAFPMSNCVRPAGQVITPSFDPTANKTDVFDKTYSCGNLFSAQDNNYIHNGVMGPSGASKLWAQNVCGAGKLHFVKDDNDNYAIQDAGGSNVGSCEFKRESLPQRACSRILGVIFFNDTYHCSSSLCK